MLVNASSSTPHCFSDSESSLEKNNRNHSTGNCITDSTASIQKMENIVREHFENEVLKDSEGHNLSNEKQILTNNKILIKISGPEGKAHWISSEDLGLQSKIFKIMFARNWKESITAELKIGSATKKSKVIDEFIECLESRKSRISRYNFQELLSLACKYEVSWLMKECEQFTASNLTKENVLSIIEDIAEPYGLSDLLRKCFIYLFQNCDSHGRKFIEKMCTLRRKLPFAELKILEHAYALKPHMSISKNPSSTFDITMNDNNFDFLAKIFSEESLGKPSVNLQFSNPSNLSALFEFLKSNPKLVSFCLEYKNISEEGAIQVAQALKENRFLTSLSFSTWGALGTLAISKIAEALKENKTLTSLNIGRNGLENTGLKKILESLKENKTLKKLNLVFNKIGVDGVTYMATLLKENVTMTHLGLKASDIGTEGAIQIAEALKKNETLTSLNLKSNDIADAGVAKIAEALKVNKTLTSLSLECNGIKDEGAIQIAEALEVNKTLKNLNLSSNRIGDAGAIQIVAALNENNTLTRLNLEQNKTEDAAVPQIKAPLQKNNRLATLDLVMGNPRKLLSRIYVNTEAFSAEKFFAPENDVKLWDENLKG